MNIFKDEKENKLQIEKLIIKLQKEFEFIKGEVEGILLYGSCANGTADVRSDIDICIIKPGKSGILQRILKKVGLKQEDRYDQLDLGIVKEALSRIDELKGNIIKIVEY